MIVQIYVPFNCSSKLYIHYILLTPYETRTKRMNTEDFRTKPWPDDDHIFIIKTKEMFSYYRELLAYNFGFLLTTPLIFLKYPNFCLFLYLRPREMTVSQC